MHPMQYEIVLYAALAVIVLTVLYSVLGRQIGHGTDEDTKPEDIFGTTRDVEPRPVAPASSASIAAEADSADEVSFGGEPDYMTALRSADPDFDAGQFLDGATTAYSMILEAFAAGERDTLAMLLTPRMEEIYGGAIDDRERQELTQVTDVVAVRSAKLHGGRVGGRAAELDVHFHSELSSALVDAVGQPVQGDPDLIANVREVWTFTRDLRSSDPTWRLSDVAPEESDEDLPADPAPDTKE